MTNAVYSHQIVYVWAYQEGNGMHAMYVIARQWHAMMQYTRVWQWHCGNPQWK